MNADNEEAKLPEHIRQTINTINSQLVPQMWRWFLDEFKLLTVVINRVEEQIARTTSEYEKAFQDAIAELDEEQRAYYADFMLDDTTMIEVLPRLQWNSQYLLVFSRYEHCMYELCKIACSRLGISKHPKNKYAPTVETFLCDHATGNEPFQGPRWEKTNLLRKLRNIIAHDDGVISEQEPLLEQLKNLDLPGVNLSAIKDEGKFEVSLSGDFLRAAINIFHSQLIVLANISKPELVSPLQLRQ